jgi:hypothetical protein
MNSSKLVELKEVAVSVICSIAMYSAVCVVSVNCSMVMDALEGSCDDCKQTIGCVPTPHTQACAEAQVCRYTRGVQRHALTSKGFMLRSRYCRDVMPRSIAARPSRVMLKLLLLRLRRTKSTMLAMGEVGKAAATRNPDRSTVTTRPDELQSM